MAVTSIRIRTISNDELMGLAPQLTGLHVQTSFTDHNGRLVSGNIHSIKPMDDGRIAINLFRYMGGKQVLDSATVPAGNDSLGRPWRTAVHVREDNDLFAELEAA